MRLSFSPSARRRAGASSSQLVLLGFLALGLAAGLLLRGRPATLGAVRLRWWGLAVGGLFFQLALFSAPVADLVGWSFGPLLYVASTAAVMAALVRNLEQPWFRLIALGAALNLAVIVANGGVMPADPAALTAVGLGGIDPSEFSRSVPRPTAATLAVLGDNWATPAWLPFASVISLGDMLIGVGAAAWIATVMLASRPARFEMERRPATV